MLKEGVLETCDDKIAYVVCERLRKVVVVGVVWLYIVFFGVGLC